MSRRVRASLYVTAVWIVCLTGAALAGGQAARPGPVMAEDVFKDIRVLRGIPVDEFMGTMGFFSSALGFNCTTCHGEASAGGWDRYADDHPRKTMARRMVQMVAAINKANFGGQQRVTCNTCHRGVGRPNVIPSIDTLYGEPPPDEPGELFQQAPRQPSAESLIDKHVAAIGGADRVAALTSFTGTGSYQGFDDLQKLPMEIFVRAPNQRTIIVRAPLGVTTRTFNGQNGWISGPIADRPVPLLRLTGQELEGVRLETELIFPVRIKTALMNWRVGLPQVIDDRPVNVVQGNTAGGAVATLCFDAETGLLVRLVRLAVSPVGPAVTRVDYDDYRDVAGVKIPFQWTVSWLSGRSMFALTDVRPNVPIDAARFAVPNLP